MPPRHGVGVFPSPSVVTLFAFYRYESDALQTISKKMFDFILPLKEYILTLHLQTTDCNFIERHYE